MVRSHNGRDDALFSQTVARVTANAQRKGHSRFASDLARIAKSAPRSAGLLVKLPHNIESVMTETIPRVCLADLVVDEATAAELQTVITEQNNREALQEAGFGPVSRILLTGPPGTGKTMTAAVLAHELGLSLRTVRLDGVISQFMGEASSKLRTVFDEFHTHRAVYFLDEVDALAASRGGGDIGEARRTVNSLLMMLEEAGPLSIMVAATNYDKILDRAIHRRFDLTVSYRPPTAAQARQIIANRLGAMAARTAVDGLPDDLFEGRSQADLVHAAETAAKQAILDGRDAVTVAELAGAVRRRVTTLAAA